MLFAFLLLASFADWVPMRWTPADAASLNLLDGTPVNCLLLESPRWSPDLLAAAHKRNLAVLGIVRPGDDAQDRVRKAAEVHLDGVVLEGDFPADQRTRLRSFLSDSKLAIVDLPSRANMRFDERPVVGTYQGVWPGVAAEDDGKAKAAPSGAPWINTNGGFLRFVRANAPDATIWLGNLPPADTIITPERYMQAICDASIIGARWIVALDDDLWKRLTAREANAVRDWKKIAGQLAWFESHKEWRTMQPLSELALVQDIDSGALYSGGVLDMIAVKHTPVRPVPTHKLSPASMEGVKMAVNVDPTGLSEAQKSELQAFRRQGGSTLSGPATWKFPPVTKDHLTLSDEDVKMLDDIWKEMNSMTGRRNLGARLFNVSSMLSNLVESTDGKHAALHLVNYSGYPVENVTVHMLGKYKSATLVAPGAEPRKLQLYDNEEGSGVDIDAIGVTATLLLE
jgi:hypothetical protein